MLEILGFMVAAYGIARLAQTTATPGGTSTQTIAGLLGIAALVVLALMLAQQANSISNLNL